MVNDKNFQQLVNIFNCYRNSKSNTYVKLHTLIKENCSQFSNGPDNIACH